MEGFQEILRQIVSGTLLVLLPLVIVVIWIRIQGNEPGKHMKMLRADIESMGYQVGDPVHECVASEKLTERFRGATK